MHGVAVALPSQEWPAGQAEHSRLTDAVGATVSCCVDEHVATGAHSLPLLWGENVCPAVHGVHVRSDVADPSVWRPLPTPHTLHVTHVLLATAEKLPVAHGVHVALPDAA